MKIPSLLRGSLISSGKLLPNLLVILLQLPTVMWLRRRHDGHKQNAGFCPRCTSNEILGQWLTSARGWEGRPGERKVEASRVGRLPFDVNIEFQFYSTKRVAELDSGDGCPTLWTYLVLLKQWLWWKSTLHYMCFTTIKENEGKKLHIHTKARSGLKIPLSCLPHRNVPRKQCIPLCKITF